MRVYTPELPEPETIDLFLAGGIRNCPNWQQDALQILADSGLTIANPRRAEGLETTGAEAARQIAWEHAALAKSNTVLFWFPYQTICPITLLELGVELGRGTKPIFIGAHPDYERRFDVQEQVALARETNLNFPTAIHRNLEDTVTEALNNFEVQRASI